MMLPFGILSAHEHFKKRTNQVLEGVPGCCATWVAFQSSDENMTKGFTMNHTAG